MENKKQNTELADILLRHRDDFLINHRLCPEQAKAYESIINCRTSELGGHANMCDHCGFTRQAYNSCRNRHCPKCQFVKQVQWVVYAKNPFARPERVIEYLGCYTHRVAISNSRLMADKDDKITFRYKDYRTNGFTKTMSLNAEEFIDRFMRHILPCGLKDAHSKAA